MGLSNGQATLRVTFERGVPEVTSLVRFFELFEKTLGHGAQVEAYLRGAPDIPNWFRAPKPRVDRLRMESPLLLDLAGSGITLVVVGFALRQPQHVGRWFWDVISGWERGRADLQGERHDRALAEALMAPPDIDVRQYAAEELEFSAKAALTHTGPVTTIELEGVDNDLALALETAGGIEEGGDQ